MTIYLIPVFIFVFGIGLLSGIRLSRWVRDRRAEYQDMLESMEGEQ